MASSTWASVAMGCSVSFASDSVIRMMASSWRTVMGMELRADACDSESATVRRMVTKCEESFSVAAGERRGAHFLWCDVSGVETCDIGCNALLAVADVPLHLLDGNLRLDLFLNTAAAHGEIHDVARDPFVAALLMLVAHDEDHVETGEDGSLEIDVLARRLEVVVAAENRVGGREDGGARVEDGGDARFGDGDSLLFHCFMDGDAILVAHLVEFIDADDAAVREHHCSAFEVELARVRVALYGGGETGGGRTLAGGVDGDGSDFLDKLEELGFCCAGVAEEEDVDVAAEFHSVGEDLLGAAEEQAGDGLFDVGVTVDGGSDAVGEDSVEVGMSGEFLELLFFLFGEDGEALCGVVYVGVDAHGTEVRVSDGDCRRRCLGTFGLVDGEDAHDCTTRAGHDARGEIAVS